MQFQPQTPQEVMFKQSIEEAFQNGITLRLAIIAREYHAKRREILSSL